MTISWRYRIQPKFHLRGVDWSQGQFQISSFSTIEELQDIFWNFESLKICNCITKNQTNPKMVVNSKLTGNPKFVLMCVKDNTVHSVLSSQMHSERNLVGLRRKPKQNEREISRCKALHESFNGKKKRLRSFIYLHRSFLKYTGIYLFVFCMICWTQSLEWNFCNPTRIRGGWYRASNLLTNTMNPQVCLFTLMLHKWPVELCMNVMRWISMVYCQNC